MFTVSVRMRQCGSLMNVFGFALAHASVAVALLSVNSEARALDATLLGEEPVELVGNTRMDSTMLKWSSRDVTISTPVPSSTCRCIMSDCQNSISSSASNWMDDDFDRTLGGRVTKARRVRTHWILEIDRVVSYPRSRCEWIASAPTSVPGSRPVRPT
jgi:hypothetical protein